MTAFAAADSPRPASRQASAFRVALVTVFRFVWLICDVEQTLELQLSVSPHLLLRFDRFVRLFLGRWFRRYTLIIGLSHVTFGIPPTNANIEI